MAGPGVSDCLESERAADDGSENSINAYLETIALLEDEIVRLERELQSRDEARMDSTTNDAASLQEDTEMVGGPKDLARAAAELERVKAELASRDETNGILLEELSRVDEAHTASRAEWERLAEWVTAIEHRVEGQDQESMREIEDRLAARQQKIDALELKFEQERRASNAQKQIYQAEISRLQEAVDEAARARAALPADDARATRDNGPDSSAIEALLAENLRLRAAWQELVERTTAAQRCESVDARLAEALDERNQMRRQLDQMADEQNRERLEHKATLAELESRLSQAAIVKPSVPPAGKKPEGVSTDLDIELRVRAMRHHFLEIHEREKEERRQKQFINRLSRLWSRTGPR